MKCLPITAQWIVLLCLLNALEPLPAQQPQTLLAPPETTKSADYSEVIECLQVAIEYEMDRKQIPAFSIAIVEDDGLVWSAGFGFQDSASQIPATADTVYRVGSLSKLFTDIVLLQQVEAGKLDLDAPVQQYLPEFQPANPYDAAITLQQLMSHRSGLVREPPVGNYFDPTEPTLGETVASLNQTTLVYPPDSKTKYSNAALAVVGAVLEKQLDQSQPDQVRQEILEPLGMKDSSFVVTPAVQSKLATGWMRTYDERRFVAPEFLLGTGPAGNLYSSVNDLSKFLVYLLSENPAKPILQNQTMKLMTTPGTDAQGAPLRFGIGFRIDELDGHKRFGHGGAVYGFSTQIEALPERKLGVVAVASLDGTNGVVGRLADYALRLMIANQDEKSLPEYATTVPVPAARAKELVGRYRKSDGDGFVKIEQFGDQVLMQKGTFRFLLRAQADDGKIITDDEVGFGTPVQLVDGDRLRVDDQDFERLPHKPPKAIPDRWRGLIGEYGWDHNTLYILEENDQLFALIEWFYYYPLSEVETDVFAFPDYGLYHGEKLKFTRDASGMATRVEAAEVAFLRREVGTRNGETFRIDPVKPIVELRSVAMTAQPPEETGPFRASDLVELDKLDPSITLDIRYATTNNFTGARFYQRPKAFMQKPAAEAVVRANQQLEPYGLGLLIHDAYRPWHVTKMFWDATPSELKDFVANPQNGSRHNRGCAVDLTLYDRQTQEPIPMVAGYDEFSPRSFPLYPGGTSRQRWYRQLLRETMEAEGFTIYEFEWWHFDFKDWRKYAIGNATFEELSK